MRLGSPLDWRPLQIRKGLLQTLVQAAKLNVRGPNARPDGNLFRLHPVHLVDGNRLRILRSLRLHLLLEVAGLTLPLADPLAEGSVQPPHVVARLIELSHFEHPSRFADSAGKILHLDYDLVVERQSQRLEQPLSPGEISQVDFHPGHDRRFFASRPDRFFRSGFVRLRFVHG
jgi:hypothetical protein